MDFSSSHFGKVLNDLVYQDVVDFFGTEKEETDQLEFKSSAGAVSDNYPGLIKTICGFLNSKGGLLIWGSPVGTIPTGRTEKTFIGALTPINEVIEKDRTISRVSDSLVPLPNGIRVKVLEDGNGGSVCLFEVDESNHSPHQFRGTYYMRIDGQTKPAPHHYVEALFRKIKYPFLEGYLKFNRISISFSPQLRNHYLLSFEVFFFNFSPLQNVEDLTFRIFSDFGTFHTILGTDRSFINTDGHDYVRRPFENVVHFGEPIRDARTIAINPNSLQNSQNRVMLFLMFGGKNCPAKRSEYILDLSNNPDGVDPETLVISRSENKLYKDVQDEKGVTRESALTAILGRTPLG